MKILNILKSENLSKFDFLKIWFKNLQWYIVQTIYNLRSDKFIMVFVHFFPKFQSVLKLNLIIELLNNACNVLFFNSFQPQQHINQVKWSEILFKSQTVLFIDIFIFTITVCIIDYVRTNDFVFVASGESVFSAVFTFNINGNPSEKEAIKTEMETAVSPIYFKFKRSWNTFCFP